MERGDNEERERFNCIVILDFENLEERRLQTRFGLSYFQSISETRFFKLVIYINYPGSRNRITLETLVNSFVISV